VTPEPRPGRRSAGLLVVAGVAVLLAVPAFLLLDVVVAAFVAILLLTAAVMAVGGSDWDRHSTDEERGQERARRRKAKWEANAAARERDRRRWEAHQARQAGGSDSDR